MFNTPITLFEDILVKIEYKNPAGSIKDRVALNLLKDAFLKGYKEIVEATSGNTGIALSFYKNRFNLKATIFMPKSYSVERQKLLKMYGANLILVDGTMKDAVAEAKEYVKKSNSYYANQFSNNINVLTHEYSTALEILMQVDKIDYFVYGVGSGGTLTGIAKILKRLGVKIVAVESKNSPVIYNKLFSKNLEISSHKIEGIGAGFIPDILDISLIDDVVLVDDSDVLEFFKYMNKNGLNGGLSTAANILAAKHFKGRVLTIAPDGVEKYL